MDRAERKRKFIRELSEFLTEGQAMMSIRLEAGTEDAKAWAKLRRATPLFGYPDADEDEKVLTDFLG